MNEATEEVSDVQLFTSALLDSDDVMFMQMGNTFKEIDSDNLSRTGLDRDGLSDITEYEATLIETGATVGRLIARQHETVGVTELSEENVIFCEDVSMASIYRETYLQKNKSVIGDGDYPVVYSTEIHSRPPSEYLSQLETQNNELREIFSGFGEIADEIQNISGDISVSEVISVPFAKLDLDTVDSYSMILSVIYGYIREYENPDVLASRDPENQESWVVAGRRKAPDRLDIENHRTVEPEVQGYPYTRLRLD